MAAVGEEELKEERAKEGLGLGPYDNHYLVGPGGNLRPRCLCLLCSL